MRAELDPVPGRRVCVVGEHGRAIFFRVATVPHEVSSSGSASSVRRGATCMKHTRSISTEGLPAPGPASRCGELAVEPTHQPPDRDAVWPARQFRVCRKY